MTKLLDDAKAAGFYVSDEGFIFHFDGFDINSQLAKFAALQQPQWIDVKDRLPEHLESVYVYMGNRQIDKYSCQTYAKDGGFSNNYGITHWMPLPSPPINTEVT